MCIKNNDIVLKTMKTPEFCVSVVSKISITLPESNSPICLCVYVFLAVYAFVELCVSFAVDTYMHTYVCLCFCLCFSFAFLSVFVIVFTNKRHVIIVIEYGYE